MKNLVEIKSGTKLEISPYAYAIEEFKALTPQELSFIYFYADPRSPYITESEDIRRSQLLQEFKVKDSQKLRIAIEKYNSMWMTPALSLVEAGLAGTREIIRYFKNVDLLELDDKGKPIHSIAQVTGALQKIKGIAEGLEALEEVLKKEFEAESKIKGQVEKTKYNEK